MFKDMPLEDFPIFFSEVTDNHPVIVKVFHEDALDQVLPYLGRNLHPVEPILS